MQSEIKLAIEAKGFQVVHVHMLQIDSVKKATIKDLEKSIITAIGYDLEHKSLQEQQNLDTIERITNQIVTRKRAELAQYKISEKIKITKNIN